MNDKERLVELIIECNAKRVILCDKCMTMDVEQHRQNIMSLADYLIANNVVVQKQGEWIVHQDKDGTWHFDCPFCDDGYATKTNHAERFCSNCGAKMVKED